MTYHALPVTSASAAPYAPSHSETSSISDSSTLAPTLSSTTTLVPQRPVKSTPLDTIKEKDTSDANADADATGPVAAAPPALGTREVLGWAALALASSVLLLEPLSAALAWPSILATHFGDTSWKSVRANARAFLDLGWYGLYYAGMASGGPVMTSLVAYNARWTLLLGLVLCTAGNILTGIATTRLLVCVGRGVAGLGAAAVPMSANVWREYRQSLAPTRQRYYLSVMASAVMACASIGAPLLSGVLCQAGAWRWVFHTQAIVAGVAAALCLALPNAKRKSPDNDTCFGIVTCAAIFASQVCAIVAFGGDWGNRKPKGSVYAAALLPSVAPMALVFAVQMSNNDAFDAAHGNTAMLAAFVSIGLSGGVSALIYTAAIRFQVENASPLSAGIRLLGLSVSMPIVSVIALNLGAVMRCHTILLLLGTCMLTGGASGLLGSLAYQSVAAEVVFLVVAGAGAGMASSVPLELVRGALRNKPDVFAHIPSILGFWSNAGRVMAIGAVSLLPNVAFVIKKGYGAPRNTEVVPLFPGIPLTGRDKLLQSLSRAYTVAVAFGGFAMLIALVMHLQGHQVMSDDEWKVHKEAARRADEQLRGATQPAVAVSDEEEGTWRNKWSRSHKSSATASVTSTRPPSYTSESTPLYKGCIVD